MGWSPQIMSPPPQEPGVAAATCPPKSPWQCRLQEHLVFAQPMNGWNKQRCWQPSSPSPRTILNDGLVVLLLIQMIIANSKMAREQTGTMVPGLHTLLTNAISVKLARESLKGGERHPVSISDEHVHDVKLQDVH